jgi:hypothetical protein
VKNCLRITPIERLGLPGEHLLMDIIGPIEPPSATGHKYILNVVCLHTRWPFSNFLRSITAENICECLCDAFSFFGVASAVSFDCGSNFTSQLTRLSMEHCINCLKAPACHVTSYSIELVSELNGTVRRRACQNVDLEHCINRLNFICNNKASLNERQQQL